MIRQLQPAAMAFGGAAGDGQAQAVAGCRLARGAKEGFAQLVEVFDRYTGAMIANLQVRFVATAHDVQLDRLAIRIEAQGVACLLYTSDAADE